MTNQLNITVSILISCYNKELYIADTLQSVINQRFTNWECIVVDDGSTDNSLSIAKQFADRDQRISVYTQKNSGVAIARNYGFKLSKGKYILPLDSDDTLEEFYLSETVQFLTQNNDTDIVFTNVRYFGDKSGLDTRPDFDEIHMLKENLIVSCSALMHREVYEKVGGYSPEYKHGIEDWDFWLQAIYHNFKFKKINKPLLNYRKIHTSITKCLKSRASNIHDMRKLIMKRNINLYQQKVGNLLDVYRFYVANQHLVETVKKSFVLRWQLNLLQITKNFLKTRK